MIGFMSRCAAPYLIHYISTNYKYCATLWLHIITALAINKGAEHVIFLGIWNNYIQGAAHRNLLHGLWFRLYIFRAFNTNISVDSIYSLNTNPGKGIANML